MHGIGHTPQICMDLLSGKLAEDGSAYLSTTVLINSSHGGSDLDLRSVRWVLTLRHPHTVFSS